MENSKTEAINQAVESYRLALLADVASAESEIKARQDRERTRKALQLAREEMMSIRTDDFFLSENHIVK